MVGIEIEILEQVTTDGIFSKISYLLFSLILHNVLILISNTYIVTENNIYKICHSQADMITQLADNLSE